MQNNNKIKDYKKPDKNKTRTTAKNLNIEQFQ